MVDRAMVQQLAAAAHIELALEEMDRLAAQLTDILEQIAPLAELAGMDAANDERVVEPVLLRADEPAADPMVGSITRFAPEVKLGFFTVPKLPSQGSGS